MLYGWLSYVQFVKKAPDFFLSYVLAMQSPALLPASQPGAELNMVIPIDDSFIHGQAPYGEPLTLSSKANWVPNVYHQLPILNKIVEAGPLIPKYSQTTNSTWELDMFYTFHFKWGGPEVTEPPVADPHQQGTYDVPDTFQTAIQIRNPAKQIPSSLLHPWDIRHGMFTKTAIKRMYDNLSIDSTFQPDAEYQPHQKRKRQAHTSHSQKKRAKKSTNLSSHSAKKISSKHQHKKTTSSSSTSSSSSTRSSSTTSSE